MQKRPRSCWVFAPPPPFGLFGVGCVTCVFFLSIVFFLLPLAVGLACPLPPPMFSWDWERRQARKGERREKRGIA